MDIVCRCTACGTHFKVDSKYSGRKARCPRCTAITIVPYPQEASGSPAAAAAPGRKHRFIDSATEEGITVTDVPEGDRSAADESTTGDHQITEPGTAVELHLDTSIVNTKSKVRKNSLRKPSPLTWIISAAVLGVLGAIAGVIVVAVTMSGQASEPVLVLDWPEAQRSDGVIHIDGKKSTLPLRGPILIPVTPGDHRVVLQRRGFNQQDYSFSAARGKRYEYMPVWDKADFVSGNSTEGSFQPTKIEDDATLAPVGYEGWQQSLELSKRKAAEKKLDIFMVFCGSDWDPASIKMANDIFSTTEFREYAQNRFVKLVIDRPKSAAGYNALVDSGQNNFLFKQFAVRTVPQVVLLDAQGVPYVRDGFFGNSPSEYVQRVNRLQAEHTVRDQLLRDAQASRAGEIRMQAAEQCLLWLRTRDVARFYPQELHDWLTLARRMDPKNEMGKLELFFTEEWISRVTNSLRDTTRLKGLIDELMRWSESRKFVDPDRAVQLHLAAAVLLHNEFSDDSAAKRHIDVALTYQPKEPRMREDLNRIARELNARDQLSSGTGFLVAPGGYILTNYHVIEGRGKVVVRKGGSSDKIPAKVVAYNAERDLALVRVDPSSIEGAQPLAITEQPVNRGAQVAAFGYPLSDAIGNGLKLTSGSVTGMEDAEGLILFDAKVNPGNSGGPLCNRRGIVVGLITAKSQVGDGLDSYGMAIPGKTVREFLAAQVSEIPADPAGDESLMPLDLEDVDVKVRDSVFMVVQLEDK